MSQFFRIIRSLLLIKSFALGAIIVVLWTRSFGIADQLSLEMGGQSTSITSARGEFIYHAIATGADRTSVLSAERRLRRLDPDKVVASLPNGEDSIDGLGFSFHRSALTRDGRGIDLTVAAPQWLLFLVGSARAIIWTIRRVLRRGMDKSNAASKLELGWCARCQSQRYGRERRCERCSSPLGVEFIPPVVQAR